MQDFKIPHNLKLEYSADSIAAAVKRLGEAITPWAVEVAQTSGKEVLAIPVLRGGVFFFADLVRQVKQSLEIAPARAWAYEPDENNHQKKEVALNLDGVPAQGRSILIVDDVCDSGRTLKALSEAFLTSGAKEVKSAVIIRRMIENQAFVPDWSGFNYRGSEWFVGYGMDDRESLRNLPAVYTLRG